MSMYDSMMRQVHNIQLVLKIYNNHVYSLMITNSPITTVYHLEYSGYFQQHSQETDKDQYVCNVEAKL